MSGDGDFSGAKQPIEFQDGTALTARGIRKSYDGRIVVSDVSIEVRPGEVVGRP